MHIINNFMHLNNKYIIRNIITIPPENSFDNLCIFARQRGNVLFYLKNDTSAISDNILIYIYAFLDKSTYVFQLIN